ncbi:hypothetical protein PUG42_06065 [Erwiniaceae bacterium L1_54_3]|nr:hypothetical protein [Erwiniaceae bacterium L1_54_3]
MKGLFVLLVASFFITGCASSTPPVCYNKAKIANHIYDVAVFKKENGKYLAGYPFHGWNDKSAFVDTSECDRLNP